MRQADHLPVPPSSFGTFSVAHLVPATGHIIAICPSSCSTIRRLCRTSVCCPAPSALQAVDLDQDHPAPLLGEAKHAVIFQQPRAGDTTTAFSDPANDQPSLVTTPSVGRGRMHVCSPNSLMK
jgi:hypothetical protein